VEIGTNTSATFKTDHQNLPGVLSENTPGNIAGVFRLKEASRYSVFITRYSDMPPDKDRNNQIMPLWFPTQIPKDR
jgi:hypothetical protein